MAEDAADLRSLLAAAADEIEGLLCWVPEGTTDEIESRAFVAKVRAALNPHGDETPTEEAARLTREANR